MARSKRNRPKRKKASTAKAPASEGIVLDLAPRQGARVPNKIDVFECVDCECEWRMVVAPSKPCGWAWERGSCPRCGSLYFEWLSFDMPERDVYLSREWFSRPPVRQYPGRATVRASARGSRPRPRDSQPT